MTSPTPQQALESIAKRCSTDDPNYTIASVGDTARRARAALSLPVEAPGCPCFDKQGVRISPCFLAVNAPEAVNAATIANERSRCAQVCRRLNESTHGFERGPDCAEAIMGDWQAVAASIKARNAPEAAPAETVQPIIDLLQDEIRHAETNDLRLTPAFGRLRGDLAIRCSTIQAVIDRFAAPIPQGMGALTDAQLCDLVPPDAAEWLEHYEASDDWKRGWDAYRNRIRTLIDEAMRASSASDGEPK